MLLGLLAWVILDAFGDDVLPDRGADADRGAERPVPVDLPAAVPRAVLRPARGRHRRHRPGAEGLTRCWSSTSSCSRAVLFCIGVYGVIARAQRRHGADVDRAHPELGQPQPDRLRADERRRRRAGTALYVIAIAAAEVGVGLAMVLMIYRNRRSIALDELSEMKG